MVADDQVLLMRDTDLGFPGSLWWTPPGGGIDEGESDLEAARRELFEETGFRTEALVGPIATRTVTHNFSDRILVQHEVFFRLETRRFEPLPMGLTRSEDARQLVGEWIDISALASYPTWPRDMFALLRATPSDPVHWGDVEESPTIA